MLDKEQTLKVLRQFGRHVTRQSKANLRKMGKSTSKRLENSIKSKSKVSKNSLQLDFEAEDYLEYQDQGVSGIKKKYPTPFSYKSKAGLKGMPPPKAFDRWNIQKGRAERDEKGRFLSRKQLNFKTAVGVFYYGIKPSRFFSTPFENAFKALPDELVEAYGLDVDNFLEFALKNRKQ